LTIVNLEASRALSSHRSSQEYERALSVIRSENEFMSHLVNDLLTLARMDSGQMAMEKNPVDLSDVAVEAIERLSPVAERNNVKLEVGELPEARLNGDRRYLLQMMSNLIENGIKYTSGGDRHVKVETGQSDDEVWVRVTDNGVGISPEHIAHLFDRFYRVDKARARDTDDEHPSGSGLGLSIVQWIAKAHRGDVHVESRPGEGTAFDVRFKTD
jgi:signal transduction histidine kinase